MDTSPSFGVWLRQRRKALHLTQDELGQQVGCTGDAIRKIEADARRPSKEIAERLAVCLAIGVDERAAFLRFARAASSVIQPAPIAPAAVALPPPPAPAQHPPLPPALPAPPPAPPLAPPALLLTKLLPPSLRRPLVPRPRLTTTLLRDHGGGVTLLVAPAGWGKTTLLAAASAAFPSGVPPLAWLALDERDADVTLVLRYVIAALQRACPAVGAAALELLGTPQPAVAAVLTLIINDVIHCDRPLVLVLDDYHVVPSPAIHDALRYLIDHLPPNLHLMIAAREDPPFPLARLRAQHRLHEIRAAELRFTPDEAAAFFADVMGLALGDEEIHTLDQRTEGWITGLQLAALALRERSDPGAFIRSFTGSHRLVLDYLTEEVLAQLPPQLHEFLLHTSILDRLCGPLCDTVRGRGTDDAAPRHQDASGQRVLDALERRNLFVVPLDDERRWYRYHHLFGGVLRERLQRTTSAELVVTLHARAATWFEAQRLVADAIPHALAAQQWQHAARLIEQIGGALFHSGATTQLQALIDAVPAAVRTAQPRLLYLLGLCARQELKLAAAHTLFVQAADAFGAVGDAVGRGDSLIYVADCARTVGAMAHARDALAEALAGPLPPARRAIALLIHVGGAIAAGEWQQARASLDDAVALIEAAGDRQALTELAVNLRSTLLLLPGSVERAERVRRLIAREPGAPVSLLRATDHFLHGMIRLQRGEIRAATDAFGQALHLTDQLGPVSQLSLDTTAGVLRCAALMGDFATADAQADRLRALLQHPTVAGYRRAWGALYTWQIGWLRWLEGRYDAARVCAAEVEALEHAHEWPGAPVMPTLLRALILLTDGDVARAASVLEAASTAQPRLRDSPVYVAVGVLLAYTYLQQHRDADAVALLREVLAWYARTGTPGLLCLTGGPVVVPLLRFAVAHQVHAAFAKQTLHLLLAASRALPTEPPAPAARAHALPNPDRLTAREQEVLRLIAAGASNSEIAARLVISMATVKKHINTIFAKLHADSRTQALVRAHERGVL